MRAIHGKIEQVAHSRTLLYIIHCSAVSILALFCYWGSTSALTYEDSTDVEFTFNPTISVSLSSANLTISNLTPGSSSDSNTVTVTVSTNAGWGYYLAATTAGNNLVNSNNSSYKFTNISSNKASLSNFSDNTWGYTYSTDNGTTWVSGDAGSTSTGYNGLPVDGSDNGATGVKLLNPSSYNSSSSVKFKIGAKASGTQASGTYTGAVNFYAVANPSSLYMQEMTLSDCQVNVGTNGNATGIGDNIIVGDARDGNDYTVRWINGQCWMTQNLRLTGGASTLALSSTLSNVSSYTMPAESASNFVTSTGYTTDGHMCSNIKNTGCWYNYYSATGGTISGGSNSTAATSDICPKNWHLPSGSNATSGTDLNKLVGNTTPDWQAATTGLIAFGAVAGGYHGNGNLSNTESGYWWSSTASDYAMRYGLRYDSSNGQFRSLGNYQRSSGFFVRCVMQ